LAEPTPSPKEIVMTRTSLITILLAAFSLGAALPAALAISEGAYACREEQGAIDECWGFLHNFTYEQYYYAIPSQFTTNDHNRIDTMDVAFFSGHGGHGSITTLRNCCDSVNFWNGTVTFGDDYNLEHMIVDACQVVPGPPDVGDAWDDGWWGVFRGLHAFYGFRTDGWWNGTVEDNFAHYLLAGQTFITAWINAANSVRDGVYPGYIGVVYASPQGSYSGAQGNTYTPYVHTDPPSPLGRMSMTWQY